MNGEVKINIFFVLHINSILKAYTVGEKEVQDMYRIKKIYQYLMCSGGRNFIIFAIIFLITVSVMLSFHVKTVSELVTGQSQNSFGAQAKNTMDCAIVIAILFVLTCISVRQRKYEMGVVRVMGMIKISMAVGVVYVTLAIIVISFLLSILSGPLLKSKKPIITIMPHKPMKALVQRN